MRILFVTSRYSPSGARWIDQVLDQGWDVHVYGTGTRTIHPHFRDVSFYSQVPSDQVPEGISFHTAWPLARGSGMLQKYAAPIANILAPDVPHYLARIIKSLKPDIIHSLKMQKESYYVLESLRILQGYLPCSWIYSAWGSDIYHHQHDEQQLLRIRAVLSKIDYLMADNPRDIELAHKYGFSGQTLGVFPGGGGYEIDIMQSNGYRKPVSSRRIIAIKGYQAAVGGQALIALEAIARCGKVFSDYKIIVHSAIDSYASSSFEAVAVKAQMVSEQCEVTIEFLPYGPPEKIWELFGKARIALAISTTDGTPNTMLEAMIMGAYPIQSNTGGLENWIENGRNGSLVAWDDPHEISQTLLKALDNDDLVESAAQYNNALAHSRLDRKNITSEVVSQYEYVRQKARKSNW